MLNSALDENVNFLDVRYELWLFMPASKCWC